MRTSPRSYRNGIQGNSAALKMTNGATNPTITTPSTCLSDTLFLNNPPDAVSSKVTGTLAAVAIDGGAEIVLISLVAGALPVPFKAKQLRVTGTSTLTAADLTLWYA